MFFSGNKTFIGNETLYNLLKIGKNGAFNVNLNEKVVHVQTNGIYLVFL